MDFLDPKAKRRHKIQLIIGYALMGVLILTTSAVLVFSAYGFDVDRKTGEVIQNGLVFVDSAPDGAAVYFNGQIQKEQTNNRFALPASNYDLKIAKQGYHDWQRKFQLDGGEVERFTYPLLIPTELKQRNIQTVAATPTLVTESPDRRWLLMSNGASLSEFTEYDLNSLDDNDVPKARNFSIPADLLTAGSGDRKLELVEWSTDNKHILLKHTHSGGYEFVILSRDSGSPSININKLLGASPTNVVLRDKKFDQWYLFTQAGGLLQSADTKKTITQIAANVTSFKSHDDNTILYASTTNDGKNQRISLRQNNKTYTLKDVANGAVMLEIARYDGAWYVVIGSTAEHKSYIYKNPVDTLNRNDGSPLVPVSIQKTIGEMTAVSFSSNTRFISTQSGQHFEIFDLEYDDLYRYDLIEPIDPGTKVAWMDGHRLIAQTGGKALSLDFDGSNKRILASPILGTPIMFDRDYTVLYQVTNTGNTNSLGLTAIDLRLDGDK